MVNGHVGAACKTIGMLHAVVPAGGSGTRLWPLSRAQRPKFLLPLTGTDSSLLQSTVERARLLSDPDHVYVVTGAAHAVDVARQLPEVPGDNIFVEPSPRDSAAAISLAAAVIAEREPTAIMGSFAADHLVLDGEAFAKTVQKAMELASTGLLMTIGITPTGPDTGFGYLRLGPPVGPGYQLGAFVEKPDQVSAVEYVSAGNYLWNAGMFVWRVDAYLAELQRHRPALHDAVRTLAAAWDSNRREALFAQLWPTLAGAYAGRLCNRAVSIADSPCRVKTGALVGLGNKPVDKDGIPLPLATLQTLEQNRYSVPMWYPDYDGIYWADGRTLDAEGGDYQVIENLRVAYKVARRMRLRAIARIEPNVFQFVTLSPCEPANSTPKRWRMRVQFSQHGLFTPM